MVKALNHRAVTHLTFPYFLDARPRCDYEELHTNKKNWPTSFWDTWTQINAASSSNWKVSLPRCCWVAHWLTRLLQIPACFSFSTISFKCCVYSLLKLQPVRRMWNHLLACRHPSEYKGLQFVSLKAPPILSSIAAVFCVAARESIIEGKTVIVLKSHNSVMKYMLQA